MEALRENVTSVESICLLSKLKTNKHIDVELEMDEFDLTAAENKILCTCNCLRR